MEGIAKKIPELKKISFEKKGFLGVYFNDGRILFLPMKYFPSLKKIRPVQRMNYQIADKDTLIFFDCNEVYHIQDFLGIYENYKYKFA